MIFQNETPEYSVICNYQLPYHDLNNMPYELVL